jgi:hypothetical protein
VFLEKNLTILKWGQQAYQFILLLSLMLKILLLDTFPTYDTKVKTVLHSTVYIIPFHKKFQGNATVH